jgi:hypothetical protein
MTMFIRVCKLFLVKNINLSLNVVGEKVGNPFLYVCSILQNNSYDNILKNIMDYNMFTLAQTSKQVSTQIGMSTLTT